MKRIDKEDVEKHRIGIERYRPYRQTKDMTIAQYRCAGFSYKTPGCLECHHGELHLYTETCMGYFPRPCIQFRCKKFQGDPAMIVWNRVAKQLKIREKELESWEPPVVRRVIRVEGKHPVTQDYLRVKKFAEG